MMEFVGFAFTKIYAERFFENTDKSKIETSLNLTSIEEIFPKADSKKDSILKVSFKYEINYSEGVAKIEIQGNLFISLEKSFAEEILKKWEKKNLSDSFKLPVFNTIMHKSNIKSLQIEDELGLLPHFQLPSLSLSKKDELHN